MKSRKFLVILAACLMLPTALHAEQGGFVGSINPNFVESIPSGPAPGHTPVPGRLGQPYALPFVPSYLGPQTPLPPGVSVTLPQYPRGQSRVSADQYISVAPPFGGRISPVDQPTGTGLGNTRQPYLPGYAVPAPVGFVPGFQGNTTVGFPQVGTTRSEVIRHLGAPRVTILRPGMETLVFPETTIVIQNGVVAVIR